MVPHERFCHEEFVQYESATSSSSNVMAKVKVFQK